MCPFPLFASLNFRYLQQMTQLYVYIHVKEDHSFLVAVAVITLTVAIVGITIAIAMTVCIGQTGQSKGRHNGYLPICLCVLSDMHGLSCVSTLF